MFQYIIKQERQVSMTLVVVVALWTNNNIFLRHINITLYAYRTHAESIGMNVSPKMNEGRCNMTPKLVIYISIESIVIYGIEDK